MSAVPGQAEGAAVTGILGFESAVKNRVYMASKKLRPGSFKSGSGKSRTPTRRTGRTAGTSQSAFAGYGFQGGQQSAKHRAQKPEEAPKESAEEPDESAGCDESTPDSDSDEEE